MTATWRDYQEEAASFFRSLGLEASTDVRLEGVRTNHDIDVVVKMHHVGFDVTWLIECKHWRTPVSKLHVLGLRSIVAELGADRGILLCEAGFQSGAVEAATLTNIKISSLESLRSTAANDITALRLRELYDRIEISKILYWDIPKQQRIEHGLREDVSSYEISYSGARSIEACQELMLKAFRGVYPIALDSMQAICVFGQNTQFNSVAEVVAIVDQHISELESKLELVKQSAN